MALKTSLGIEVSKNHVAMAYLKATFRDIKLAAYGIYTLEAGKDPEDKVASVRELIRDFQRKNRISSTDIFLGIPRDLAILRYVELPLSVKENLRETLRYEMDKYVPFSLEDVYFDYQIISEDKDGNILRLLLVAVRKASADPYFELRNDLGLGISGVEIGSTAMANFFSFIHGSENGGPHAIIFLRGDDLEFSLLQKNLLRYSKAVTVKEGSNGLSDRILEELRPIKEVVGPEQGPLEGTYCAADETPELKGMVWETSEFDIRPFEFSGVQIPSYTLIPAYGLALRGMKKVPMEINLLPRDLRKKASKAGYYTMFVLAGLLILAFLGWAGSGILRQRVYLNQLDQEIQRLHAEIAKIDRVNAKSREIEDQIDFLQSLRSGHVPVLDILKDLSQNIPESAWVRNLIISDDGVQMEGYAESASELIPLLEGSPLFRDVAFLSPITKSRDGKERFRIGLQVN